MRPNDGVVIADLAAALAQIADQFLATFELRAHWLIAIEIADQADPERDVVEIIAMHVAAVDLPSPTIAHFDLPIAGRCSIADDKMVGETILHASHMSMVIIEGRGIALPRAAVVHDDEFPAPTLDRRFSNRVDRRAG